MIGIFVSAYLDVRTRPIRTLAAVTGMIAAVCAVVVVNAAAHLSNSAANEYLAAKYGRSATMEVTATDPNTAAATSQQASTDRLASALRNNGFDEFSFYDQARMAMVEGDRSIETDGAFVSPQFARIHVLRILSGAVPRTTAQALAAHALIDSNVAAQLGLSATSAVGKVVRYDLIKGGGQPNLDSDPSFPVVIDGVIAPDTNDTTSVGVLLFSQHIEEQWSFDANDLLWFVHVRPVDVEMVKSTIEGLADPGNPTSQAFSVSRTDMDEELAPVLDQQKTTSQAVSLVALVVGGLGILAVGLASSRERRREFALRRALGATRPRIFALVLLQTVVEVLVAGAIAIPLAVTVVIGWKRELVLATLPLPTNTSLPATSVYHGLFDALLVGFLAGLIPALRSASGSIVHMLRE